MTGPLNAGGVMRSGGESPPLPAPRWRIGEIDEDGDLGHSPAILRLDYDRPRLPRDVFTRAVNALRWLRLRPVAFVCRRTARGWHVKIGVCRKLNALTVVCLQALLGSDPKREVFNLLRARALRRAPPEWRSRFSVLFRSKL